MHSLSDVPGFIASRDYFKAAGISGNRCIARSRLRQVVFETALAWRHPAAAISGTEGRAQGKSIFSPRPVCTAT